MPIERQGIVNKTRYTLYIDEVNAEVPTLHVHSNNRKRLRKLFDKLSGDYCMSIYDWNVKDDDPVICCNH